MKTEVSPAIAAIVIAIAVALTGSWLYLRAQSQPQYGAPLPPVVLKEFREKGPRPMPPMPMPNGRYFTPQGGAVGPPAGQPKAR
jgi:hypothetical protein